MYDLSPYSFYKEFKDKNRILSGNSESDKMIESAVINIIIPEAFRDVLSV